MKKLKASILMILVCGAVWGQVIDDINKNIIGYNRFQTGSGDWMDIQLIGAGSKFQLFDHPMGKYFMRAQSGNNYLEFPQNVFVNGNVGIGNSDPLSKLHIKSSGEKLSILRLENATWKCNQETAIEFWNGSHHGVATSKIISKMNNCGEGGENLLFQTQSPASVNPNQLEPTTKLFIGADGKVGIGTTTPKLKLHVFDSSSGNNPDNVHGLFVENAGSANEYFVFQTATIGGGKSFSVTNLGRVGIGTTTPSAKLDVAGNIKAHEIEVTLASMQDLQLNGTLAANNITYTANGNTADFVFEDNYQLKDLSEVEAFIKANKHLPEIPSASEMEATGVNLAEMNKLLLMKVEELTLYSIEQEKKIEARDEKVESLEFEVEELKKMVIELINTSNLPKDRDKL